ncbi:transposase [Bacillus glycinifermentans]
MECHKKHRGIYGYRRVQIWLKKTYGLHINHKRIQRLMNKLGIRQSSERRNHITERRKHMSCQTTI